MNRYSFPKNFRFVVYSTLVVMLLFSCTLPGLPTPPSEPTPTTFQEPLPPIMAEVSPLDGSQLGPNDPIIFYFSESMVRNSVEAALYGLPTGSLTWTDDSTLTFTPDPAYEADSEITVAVLSSAKAANGLTLVEPVTLTFTTSPLLRAINILPEPASQDINPQAAVAVTFNQPVVPLGSDTGLPDAFSIEPAVNGRGEWLSTSTYIFNPDPALAGGEIYTVSLNTDLKSTSGAPIDLIGSSLAWSFETALPRLVSLTPSNEQTLPLDSSINLAFNQAMSPSSFEDGFVFLGGGVPVTGTVTWNADFTEMSFTPDALLNRNAIYTLNITQQVTSANGTPLALEQQFQYYTYGNFTFNGSSPGEGEIKSETGSVSLFFTSPPKKVDHLEDYISIKPDVFNLGIYTSESTSINLSGFFIPETNYTVTVSPDLLDQWDQPLRVPVELSFRTPPASPSLNVAYWGNIYFVRPDEPVLQANATNIQRADVAVAPLTLTDFQLLTGPDSYTVMQAFVPQNSTTHSKTYRLTPSRSEPVTLPLTNTGEELSPGFYFMQVTSPQLDQTTFRNYLIAASHINLTFKIGATDALLWATDLRTGEPVSAPFMIYDNKGTTLISSQTDKNGLWQGTFDPLESPNETFLVVLGTPGEENFGVAQSSWSTGISAWEFGIDFRPRAPEPKTYIYTDRPIYRPGQTVYFRGVVRDAYNGRYGLPTLVSVPLEVRDTNGRILQSLNLPLSPYGTFNGEVQLSASALPGYYSLNNDEMQIYLSFTVAEYRKPEIELEVAFVEDHVENGQEVLAQSEAKYYFGSPAGDMNVQWTLYERPSYFHLPGYQTGVIDNEWMVPSWARYDRYGRTLDSGTTRTEPDGSLMLTFEDVPASTETRALTLELTVQDESGFPVSARGEILVHPANFYIGLRPDQWVGQSGREIGFDVLTADWETSASPQKALQAEFKQVRWERIDPPPEDVYGMPTYEPIYTLVGSSNLTTGPDGKARLSFTPDAPGTYMLDVYGSGARTQVLVWVMGGQDAAWPNLLNDQVSLTTDQESYQPGETARIFIPNPFGKQVKALVTVERGVVLSAEVLTLGTSGSTYSLELTDEHAPNVYVAATLLGPKNQFRQGYVTVEVAPTAQELQVELTAEPEINEPRGEMTLRLRVTDISGEPVQGEFSLSVVDKALLALEDPNSVDILTAFYSKQALGVSTGLSLANYSGRYVLQPLGRGGGGGDGLIPVREEFPDTAYWNPTFITDSDGMGRVTLTLPDNLTTWVIEARGLTLDTRVGQAKTEAITTKPLLIRPVTPRFFVAGDHAELSAIVHNNTDSNLTATVTLDATGFILDKSQQSEQTVEVASHDHAQVTWWGTADDVEAAELVFAVNGRGGGQTLSDAATPALGPVPIHQYVAPQTFVTSGMLLDSGTRREVISLPRSFSPTSGRLDVEMSPSLAASILASLEALPTPSCSCNNEAVLSYFLPNLETYRALQAAGINNPDLQARLDESLNDSVAALVNNQNYDGGWGWISGSDSDPNISSYLLFGLGRARLAGISIPDDTFTRAHDFLREYALEGNIQENQQTWELDRLNFTLFALTNTGGLQETDIPLLYTLFDKRDQLNPWSQALLALSLESVASSDARARELIVNLEATAIRTGSSANWESETVSWRNPGTPLFTTAVVVYALAQRDSAAPVLIDAVRYLSSHRDAHSLWGSPYENAWVLLALTEAMKGFGELQADFTFSATVNGAPLASGDVSGTEIFTPVTASVPLEYLSNSSPNDLAIQRESGLGRLYYRASLLLNRSVETVQPLSKGMDVNRAYFEVICKDNCPPLSVTKLSPGSHLTAHLTLTLLNDSYYVILEDYIPAGTEILNQMLNTSMQGDESIEIEVYDPKNPYARGWGWWYFNEPQIHDDRITWTADYLPAGTYELTYTLIPTQIGQFHVLPAHAWQAFFPDVQGTSAGKIFEIR